MSKRLALVRRARMKRDEVRGIDVLLLPESVIELNAQGAEVLRLCDGTRTLEEIVSEVRGRYAVAGAVADVEKDVRAFVARLEEKTPIRRNMTALNVAWATMTASSRRRARKTAVKYRPRIAVCRTAIVPS
jgi:pyrroloquinoline quinone biosynthesis protein D